MNELITQTIDGLIESNLGTIAEDIKKQLAEYEGYVVSEETIKDGKNLLAQFRKQRKELDDSRKDGKNRYMEKWNNFESKLKPVIALYDEKINEIDEQVKEVEKNRIQAKRERIKVIYDEVIGDMGEYAPLDFIYDKKWENATASEKSIREEMTQSIGGIQMMVDTIKMNDKYADKGLEEYKKSHNLQSAMQKMKDFEWMEKSIREEEPKQMKDIPEEQPEKVETHTFEEDSEITFIIHARDIFHAETIEFALNENGIEYERMG